MLKIFLTGDNHIGLKYAKHEKAKELISARIDAFEEMVRKANEENCGLFVIAGDLFDRITGIAKKDIKSLVEMLSKFTGVVTILPGNHDYYDSDVKIWQDLLDVIDNYDNIKLFTEYKPYEITVGDDEVVIYPAFCSSLHSAPGENNLGWIKEQNITSDGKYHIGIAHGAVEGETIDSEGRYFLMTRDELEDIPVDAWLIGHTHVPFPDTLEEDKYISGDKIFNAGTHVQTDVSCNTEGYCFIIEIDANKKVSAKKFVSGNIRFYRRNVDVSAGELENKLDSELRILPKDAVVDLVLTGAVSTEEYEKRDAIISKALSVFLEGTYNDHALSKLITEESIDSEFSETSFSAGFLKALLNDPKEAQLAYELLQTVREER